MSIVSTPHATMAPQVPFMFGYQILSMLTSNTAVSWAYAQTLLLSADIGIRDFGRSEWTVAS